MRQVLLDWYFLYFILHLSNIKLHINNISIQKENYPTIFTLTAITMKFRLQDEIFEFFKWETVE